MRTIKFRMWNPHRGQNGGYQPQLDQVMACLHKQVLFDSGDFILGYDYKADGFVFEQFTGLLDKHGKEIYEGDKCDLEYYYGHDVVPQHVHNGIEIKYFDFNMSFMGIGMADHPCHIRDYQIEITGNIHDHEPTK